MGERICLGSESESVQKVWRVHLSTGSMAIECMAGSSHLNRPRNRESGRLVLSWLSLLPFTQS